MPSREELGIDARQWTAETPRDESNDGMDINVDDEGQDVAGDDEQDVAGHDGQIVAGHDAAGSTRPALDIWQQRIIEELSPEEFLERLRAAQLAAADTERENEGGGAGDMDLSISAGALLTEDEFGFMLAAPEDDLDFGNGR